MTSNMGGCSSVTSGTSNCTCYTFFSLTCSGVCGKSSSTGHTYRYFTTHPCPTSFYSFFRSAVFRILLLKI